MSQNKIDSILRKIKKLLKTKRGYDKEITKLRIELDKLTGSKV